MACRCTTLTMRWYIRWLFVHIRIVWQIVGCLEYVYWIEFCFCFYVFDPSYNHPLRRPPWDNHKELESIVNIISYIMLQAQTNELVSVQSIGWLDITTIDRINHRTTKWEVTELSLRHLRLSCIKWYGAQTINQWGAVGGYAIKHWIVCVLQRDTLQHGSNSAMVVGCGAHLCQRIVLTIR